MVLNGKDSQGLVYKHPKRFSRFPRTARRRAEKARPHAARSRAVMLQRRVGVASRTDGLMVMDIKRGLFRREPLKRRDIGALVDDDGVVVEG